LVYLVPVILAIIALLLYINFRIVAEVAILMGTLPFALVGSVWLIYWEGFNFSIAVGVGFIALAGVAIETSVIMMVYLNQAYDKLLIESPEPSRSELANAVIDGAGLRVRPVMMTAAATIVGLLPILYGAYGRWNGECRCTDAACAARIFLSLAWSRQVAGKLAPYSGPDCVKKMLTKVTQHV
jgi:Cu(I)/Ag(I) efflux system membrane protein CusA/SilA